MRLRLMVAMGLLAMPGAALAQWDSSAQSYNDWAVSSALTTMNNGMVERAARGRAAAKGSGRMWLSPKSEAICARRERGATDARGRKLNQLCRMAGR